VLNEFVIFKKWLYFNGLGHYISYRQKKGQNVTDARSGEDIGAVKKNYTLIASVVNKNLTSGCIGQISAVTFCAKKRTKTAIKNLLGEPGVAHSRYAAEY
jgi:hypothetical protein